MTTVECAECGSTHGVREFIHNDDECPSCGVGHVVPRLHAALYAVQRDEHRGWSLEELLGEYGLDHDDACNLLMALGVSAGAALDVERRLQGWPGSRWRRLVGLTREEEARHVREVTETVREYGLEVGVFEE